MDSLSFLSDSLKSVSIFFTVARSLASFRALARVFWALILFCSSVVFFLKSSVSVLTGSTEASVPSSPITAMLLTPREFTATPAPMEALVLALPRARPPTMLVTVLLLLAVMVKLSAASAVVSSSTSTRLLLSPVSTLMEPEADSLLSALPALRMIPVWVMSLAAFRTALPPFAFMTTFLPDRIRLSPEKSCTATLAPTPLPLLSEKAKYSPPLPVALTTLVSVVASILTSLPAVIFAFSPTDTIPLLCSLAIFREAPTATLLPPWSLDSTV